MSERLINEMTATEIRDYLVSGKSSSTDFYERLLAFIDSGDEAIKAFVNRDDRIVNLHAQHLDDSRTLAREPGQLYGVPIAVKDIIDTADYPTEYGSKIYEGRYSAGDASVVRRLRDAGAVIVGKTATTEFATFTPAQTRNPHNLDHTPGGSSSGSAAAVAAGFVPVALGSQTNGSVIRPASFCGVYGFKPSRGLIPLTGAMEQSPSLDQLGLFGRNIEDIALVTEVINGDDGLDPGTQGQLPIRMLKTALSEPPVQPKFCFFKTPWWDKVDPEAREAYEALIDHLGTGLVSVLEVPEVLDKAIEWQKTVQYTEMAFAFQREFLNYPDQLSDRLKDQIKTGMNISVMDYLAAKDRIPHVASAFDEYFEHFDAILCPAALGTAPKGLGSTGDPIMQTIWTFAGLPALSLPMLTLSNGLPLGVQAIGQYKDDARLLRTARWLVHEFTSREEN